MEPVENSTALLPATLRIREPSKNGDTIEKGTVFPNYPANNSHVKCNANSVDGEIIARTLIARQFCCLSPAESTALAHSGKS